MINNESVNGSEKTVKLAVACGVRPQWLDSGEGEMVATTEAISADARAILYLIGLLNDKGKKEIKSKIEEWVKDLINKPATADSKNIKSSN